MSAVTLRDYRQESLIDETPFVQLVRSEYGLDIAFAKTIELPRDIAARFEPVECVLSRRSPGDEPLGLLLKITDIPADEPTRSIGEHCILRVLLGVHASNPAYEVTGRQVQRSQSLFQGFVEDADRYGIYLTALNGKIHCVEPKILMRQTAATILRWRPGIRYDDLMDYKIENATNSNARFMTFGIRATVIQSVRLSTNCPAEDALPLERSLFQSSSKNNVIPLRLVA